eukprot:3249355-Pyramimonas_sp.AAC.1
MPRWIRPRWDLARRRQHAIFSCRDSATETLGGVGAKLLPVDELFKDAGVRLALKYPGRQGHFTIRLPRFEGEIDRDMVRGKKIISDLPLSRTEGVVVEEVGGGNIRIDTVQAGMRGGR